MTVWLKQSTAVTVQLGPFVDDADGNTEMSGLETTLEANAATGVQISKNGSAFANATPVVTFDDNGWYRVDLTTTHTNTLGELTLSVFSAGSHLAVFRSFMVVPANIYDSIVGGTDILDASVTQWLGQAVAAVTVNGVPEVDLTHIAGSAVATGTAQLGVNVVSAASVAWASGAITSSVLAANAIGASQLASGAITNAKFAAGAIDAPAIATDAIDADAIADAAITALTFAAGAIDSTAIATDAIGAAELAAGAITADVFAAGAINAAAVADATIDAATFAAGAIDANAIATDAIGSAELAASAVTEITTGLATAASIAALNNLSAAQVNAEVLDVFTVDTFAELTDVPAATSTLKDKLNWLFMLGRNRVNQTATTTTVYADDASTTLSTSTVSDNGTTFERGEWTP